MNKLEWGLKVIGILLISIVIFELKRVQVEAISMNDSIVQAIKKYEFQVKDPSIYKTIGTGFKKEMIKNLFNYLR